MVTKAASDETVGLSVVRQLTGAVAGAGDQRGVLFIMSWCPACPSCSCGSSLLVWLLAYASAARRSWVPRREWRGPARRAGNCAARAARRTWRGAADAEEEARRNLEQLLSVDILELEIGYG